MSSTQLRTTPDRLRYLVLYEGIGLALVAPLISQLFGQGVAEVGSLAIFFSIVATAWTYGWNLLFDKGVAQALRAHQQATTGPLPARIWL
ncbi:chlorhexidine efflux transporter [Aeromonas veronii]|uniref:chlorhexidine efflux transporter n=1 Tax=Aeromonas veronii TaxID=654 RepID=UPI001F2967AA|nr:chlorhexidine efflux transporter [Aeromonas veronii]